MSFQSFDEGKIRPLSEINTTPLVDVMLVLLVIFIITAPLFQQAVPVDLPKTDSMRLEERPEAIQLTIDARGTLIWNGDTVDEFALGRRFQAAAQDAAEPPELHLRANRDTRYEIVARVMAAAQNAGVTRIAFVTATDDHR
jgi:biopolymer transport protein ExbD